MARRGEASLSQIARAFGISESCLHRWLKLADVDGGVRPGVTSQESAELRELRRRNRTLEQENEIPAPGGRVLRPGDLPKMSYPLVLDLAADKIPVSVTCRVLGFSRQAFYAWRQNPVSQRDWDDAQLINAAIDIHGDDPEFGYRFIATSCPERGIVTAENRVARLCSQQQIWSVLAKKRGLGRKAGFRCTTTWSPASSPRPAQTGSGSPTSPSTRRGEGKLCGLAVPGDPGGELAGCPGEKAPTIGPGLRR